MTIAFILIVLASITTLYVLHLRTQATIKSMNVARPSKTATEIIQALIEEDSKR